MELKKNPGGVQIVIIETKLMKCVETKKYILQQNKGY